MCNGRQEDLVTDSVTRPVVVYQVHVCLGSPLYSSEQIKVRSVGSVVSHSRGNPALLPSIC